MKKYVILAILAALAAFCPPVLTSCSTPPSQRVVTVQTLKAIGQSAESAVASSAQLYASGTISAPQARSVMDFYNLKFQPAYRLAVIAANSDLSSVASPDLINLAAQLSSLVLQYSQPKTITP